jgi:hypothetical protein
MFINYNEKWQYGLKAMPGFKNNAFSVYSKP